MKGQLHTRSWFKSQYSQSGEQKSFLNVKCVISVLRGVQTSFLRTPARQKHIYIQGCIYLIKNILQLVILFLIDGTNDFWQMIKTTTSIEGVKTFVQ